MQTVVICVGVCDTPLVDDRRFGMKKQDALLSIGTVDVFCARYDDTLSVYTYRSIDTIFLGKILNILQATVILECLN